MATRSNAIKKRVVELEDAVVRLFTGQGPAPTKKTKKKSSRKANVKAGVKRAATKTAKRAKKATKRKVAGRRK